jgi:predicted porin
MKKHLIAAAVAAAVAVPAVAQNVTISGTFDINPWSSEKVTVGDGATTGERSGSTGLANRAGGWSTSVLSFSGTEDLGGGLRAGFFFNQELRQIDGSENARDFWLSLGGPMGTIQVGRGPTLIESTYGNFAVSGTTNTAGTSDSTGFDLVVGSLGNTQTIAAIQGEAVVTVATAAAGSGARQSGVVRYTTASFDGLTASVELINSLSDAATGTAGSLKARQETFVLAYSKGALALAAGTATRKTTDTGAAETRALGTVDSKARITTLGASYDLGSALIKYAYGARKDTEAGADTSDLKVHNIGLTVPVGALSFTANYYDGEDDRNGTVNNKKDLTGHQVGMRYSLSKRTTAYLVHGQNQMQANGTATDGVKRTQTGAGLIHTF